MKSLSPLQAFALVMLNKKREEDRVSGLAAEVEEAYYFPDIPKSASRQGRNGLGIMTGKKIARLLEAERQEDPDKEKKTALAGLLGGGADAFLNNKKIESNQITNLGLKIDRLASQSKRASLSSEILQHKNEPWFYPAVGGLAGSLLATPEAISDMKDNKMPHALRRLVIGAGIGSGVGYLGNKAIRGELSDIKKALDSLKSQISE